MPDDVRAGVVTAAGASWMGEARWGRCQGREEGRWCKDDGWVKVMGWVTVRAMARQVSGRAVGKADGGKANGARWGDGGGGWAGAGRVEPGAAALTAARAGGNGGWRRAAKALAWRAAGGRA